MPAQACAWAERLHWSPRMAQIDVRAALLIPGQPELFCPKVPPLKGDSPIGRVDWKVYHFIH